MDSASQDLNSLLHLHRYSTNHPTVHMQLLGCAIISAEGITSLQLHVKRHLSVIVDCFVIVPFPFSRDCDTNHKVDRHTTWNISLS